MKLHSARKISFSTFGLMLGAVFTAFLLSACKGGNRNNTTLGDRVEETRITSPDSRFDAVITREAIGSSLGGVYWSVFIIPKGGAVPKDDKKSILYAATLRGEKPNWKRDHLLEVHYDIAHIEEFRNLWGLNEVESRGWRTGDYLIEVRLVPSSPDFSLLTPDGGFKPRE
jgi:hypothetical protein